MPEISINARSSIRIEGTKIIYFDPFKITDEKRDADMVFITHEHYDHFSPEDIVKITNKKSVLVVPESMKKLVVEQLSEIVGEMIFVNPNHLLMNIVKDDILVKWVRAYNVDKQFHRKESDWVGYVVTIDGITYFVPGDTDENEDNVNVSCDVMLVPCGGKYTCDAKEAAQFTKKINPRKVIPTHYTDVAGDSEIGLKFKEEVLKLVPDIEVEVMM